MASGERLWVPGSAPRPRNDGETVESGPLSDATVQAAFEAAGLAEDVSPLLLAVSGGPDSTALMHGAAAWSRASGRPPLAVATVDHSLRPGSRQEAEGVGRAAASLGLPHAILTWTDRTTSPVSQEAAREARYRLLATHAAEIGAKRFATAHTLDDQVETILMRLAAGSGLSGLAGMAPQTRRGKLLHLRPFLAFRKGELVATCKARGWSFVEDPTNRDPRYARPRWRALASLLAAEGLTPERVIRLGERLRRADVALEETAERVASDLLSSTNDGAAAPPSSRAAAGRVARLDLARLAREPDEVGLRVLVRALAAAGAARTRLERIEAAYGTLVVAHRAGKGLRRTLAGRLLSLDTAGFLTIRPEPPRRRGRQ